MKGDVVTGKTLTRKPDKNGMLDLSDLPPGVTNVRAADPEPPAPKRRHGIGRAGVDRILAEQRGGCAICGVPYENVPGKRLAMDHDHRHCPGKVGCPVCVRGMLCNSCNNMLRAAKDSPMLLRRAADYLSWWGTQMPKP